MKRNVHLHLVLVLVALCIATTACGEKKAEPAPAPPAAPTVAPVETPAAAPAVETPPAAAEEAPAQPAAAPTAEPKEQYVFESKKGNVTFNHVAHKDIDECVKCHHAAKDGAAPAACRTCHGVDEKAPSMKDVGHKLCKDCHKENGVDTRCDACHAK